MIGQFNTAVLAIKDVSDIDNETKLFLYANYKQALFGDNNKEKPSIFNRVEMAKWKEWHSIRGKSNEAAMKDYIDKVNSLIK